jgi:hypothetical protein
MDQALGQIVGKIDAGQKIGPDEKVRKGGNFSGEEKGAVPTIIDR